MIITNTQRSPLAVPSLGLQQLLSTGGDNSVSDMFALEGEGDVLPYCDIADGVTPEAIRSVVVSATEWLNDGFRMSSGDELTEARRFT